MKKILCLCACLIIIFSFIPIANADDATLRIDLAQQILNNDNIVLKTTNSASKYQGKADGADAKQNIIDTASGKKAKRSSYADTDEGLTTPAPGGEVYLSVNMLRAMLEMEKEFGKYRVTAIAGGCHSANSSHYLGVSFDATDAGTGATVQKGKEIYNYLVSKGFTLNTVKSASSYGVWENSSHYHIQVTGYSGSSGNATLDINGYLDGEVHGNLENYGTFDVWINDDNLVADNVNDFCQTYSSGTYYEITDFVHNDGIHTYHGVKTGALEGTLNSSRVEVQLIYRTNDSIGDNFYAYITDQSDQFQLYNNSGNVGTERSSNAPSHIWHFERLNDNNHYKITSYIDGKAFDVTNGDPAEGTNLQVVPFTAGNPCQVWVCHEENGYVEIGSPYTPCVVDCGGDNDTNTYLAREYENRCQWFKITKISESNLPALSYTVSYNANGGTGAPGSQTKTYGQTLTLSNTKPTRASTSAGSYKVTLNANGGSVSPASMDAAHTTSYTFKNWNTKADGSGTSYNAGASYTANAAATLYAQWNSSTITGAVTLPTPTRSGYTFKGWATSSTASSGVTGSYTPSGNVTLYAVWQRENYYLDINGWLDGQSYSHIEGYGTADMYINGTLAGQVKTDFYKAFPSGTTYEIKNIRPTEGHAYYGIKSGSRTGTISNNTSIQLDFRTCPTSISETPDTLVFNGHTYCLYSTPMTWYDAKTLCEALGGHLATITSAEEDQAVAGLLHGDINAWLGATDIDREGEWHWITGESFSYTNWMTGQPDNGSSNPEGAENYLQYRDEG